MADEIKNFLRDFSWTGFGIASALFIEYLFYLIAGRLLGPATFGIFGVIMSFYYITVRSPFSVIELTSRKIETDSFDVFQQLGRKTLLMGFMVFAVFLLSSPLISSVLGIPLKPFMLFCLVFPLSYFTAVGLGSLQGAQKFREYAFFEINSSLTKFLAVFLIAFSGWGLIGAVMAPVLEVFAGFAVIYYFLKPSLESAKFQYKDVLVRSAIIVFAINMAFNIDLILLKFFYPSETVGLYYSISVVGKAIIFGSAAINKTVFPRFNGGKIDSRLLTASMILLASGGALAMLFFKFFGDIFIDLTFGAQFSAASSFAPAYMLFITLVGACGVMGNYYLSTERKNLKLLLLLPAIQIFLIVLFHETVFQVIYSGITASLITLLALLNPLRKSELR